MTPGLRLGGVAVERRHPGALGHGFRGGLRDSVT